MSGRLTGSVVEETALAWLRGVGLARRSGASAPLSSASPIARSRSLLTPASPNASLHAKKSSICLHGTEVRTARLDSGHTKIRDLYGVLVQVPSSLRKACLNVGAIAKRVSTPLARHGTEGRCLDCHLVCLVDGHRPVGEQVPHEALLQLLQRLDHALRSLLRLLHRPQNAGNRPLLGGGEWRARNLCTPRGSWVVHASMWWRWRA